MKKALVLAVLLGLVVISAYIPGRQKKPIAVPEPVKQAQPLQKPAEAEAEQSSSAQKQIEIVAQLNTKNKIMALTFDDGPDPRFTPQILQVLKEHGVKATFFLLGRQAERYPAITALIAGEGHETGIHSYDHKFLNRLPAAQVQKEIDRTYDVIYRITGKKPLLFRPPYGFRNSRVLKAAANRGLKIILWTPRANPRDFENPGIKKIVSRVLANARPGVIVLLHDHGGDRRQTVLATEIIITKLKARGYEFDTISSLNK